MPLQHPHRRRAAVVAAAVVAAALSGCVIAPLGSHYPVHGAEGPTVDVAPPPAQVEVVPVAPLIGHIWIGGHWGWHAGRHVWIGGRWAAPPRGYRGWTPGYWGRHGHGWRWHGGHWRRR